MLCIDNRFTDIYFNLAAEEFLLKKSPESIFMLWQSDPAVVIGKYQYPSSEADFKFLNKKQILFARRSSGGGAVYQDLGNLNFTFIESNESGKPDRFSRRVTSFLSGLGVPVGLDERNNLLIDGLKISGSAQCIYKNRILHHGTLLYSSRLDDLYASLQGNLPAGNGKYVSSVKSRVTNVNEYMPQSLSVDGFRTRMMDYFLSSDPDNRSYSFSDTDLENICTLRNQKYITPEWKFSGKIFS